MNPTNEIPWLSTQKYQDSMNDAYIRKQEAKNYHIEIEKRYDKQLSIIERMRYEMEKLKQETASLLASGNYVTIPAGEKYAPEDTGIETVTDCVQNVCIISYIRSDNPKEDQDCISFIDEDGQTRLILVSNEILEANGKQRMDD